MIPDRKNLVVFSVIFSGVTVLALVLVVSVLSGKGRQEVSMSSPKETARQPSATQGTDDIRISNVSAKDSTIVDVVKKVSKHILLPDGNVTVTTITNAENLRKIDPVFYKFARVGDKLLLYEDRGILYNPTLDKILDISHAVSRKDLGQ